MATVRNIGVIAQLRSEASSHIIRFRNGRVRQSGRGLVFWFRPETASISEVPVDDREMTLFVRGRSRDFQTVVVQGTIGWHVVDPELLASRVDFSIDLRTGRLQGEPIERIEARLGGIAGQAVLQYLGASPIGALLDAGPEPLRAVLERVLFAAPALAEIGIAAVAVRLTNLAPTSELERALQTPTFEALQQKADEATFARRALAVEKERAIAENELATKTELARRETVLIAQEAENARDRAAGVAEARGLEAAAEAERIRLVEGARAEAEQRRAAIYRDMPPAVLLGLAARELAGKLETIEHVNVTPDLLAAQRGATLTGQLLAFARKQPLAPAPVDLAATMPDLIPLLRRTLGEHIEVRYVETAGLWPAMADPAQLESAVLNLALNARDAMPGGGRLTIELGNRVLDEAYARDHAEIVAGDYAMVAVSDTGHGMTPEVAARVFEPFFTTKPDGKGTGLGLAMVFGFVRQSGGHVKIYSEPDEGTTVKIYLPRALGSVAAAPLANAPVELPRGSATVLVVEDEAGVREIACAILSDLGYRVLEAADGEDALKVFGANVASVDLLLTDVVLPGKVRGRELAERVQALRPEVRVVFMSGYTENSIVHHGRLDDGVHLVGKPFKREQLARKVAEVLCSAASAGAGNVVTLRPVRDTGS